MADVTYEQTDLLLRLYDMRREPRLREALAWFMNEFQAKTVEEFMAQCPPGSREEASFRMVTTFFDMCASLVNRGLIDEDLYFSNVRYQWGCWCRIEPIIAGVREMMKDALFFSELEKHAQRYREWAERRSPGSADGVRDYWNARSRFITESKGER